MAVILCDLVDKWGARFPEELLGVARHYVANPLDDHSSTALVPPITASTKGGSGPQIRHEALFFLLNKPIKECIRRAVEEIPYEQEPGLPLAERLPKLEKMDREIEKLEAELSELREQAAAAGLQLRNEGDQ